jgi:hypothetical protein
VQQSLGCISKRLVWQFDDLLHHCAKFVRCGDHEGAGEESIELRIPFHGRAVYLRSRRKPGTIYPRAPAVVRLNDFANPVEALAIGSVQQLQPPRGGVAVGTDRGATFG